jgi:hypothetical protein
MWRTVGANRDGSQGVGRDAEEQAMTVGWKTARVDRDEISAAVANAFAAAHGLDRQTHRFRVRICMEPNGFGHTEVYAELMYREEKAE